MATLSDLLSQVRQLENGGNYTGTNPKSTASGAYQFVNGTWKQLTNESGIGTQYATAGSAPPAVQDAVAAYAATHYDPNSSFLWQESAKLVPGGGGYPAITSTDSPGMSLTDVTNPNNASPLGSDFSGSAGSLFSPGSLTYGLTVPSGSTVNPDVLATATDFSGSSGGTDTYSTTVSSTSPDALFGDLSSIYSGGASIAGALGSATQGAAASGSASGFWTTLIGDIQNFLSRFGLILVGIVLIAAAAWAFSRERLSYAT